MKQITSASLSFRDDSSCSQSQDWPQQCCIWVHPSLAGAGDTLAFPHSPSDVTAAQSIHMLLSSSCLSHMERVAQAFQFSCHIFLPFLLWHRSHPGVWANCAQKATLKSEHWLSMSCSLWGDTVGQEGVSLWPPSKPSSFSWLKLVFTYLLGGSSQLS